VRSTPDRGLTLRTERPRAPSGESDSESELLSASASASAAGGELIAPHPQTPPPAPMYIPKSAQAARTNLLSEKNPIAALAGIALDEKSHTYTYRGAAAPVSATGLVAPHFPQFDAAAVVAKNFERWRERPESPYCAVIRAHDTKDAATAAILEGWKRKGDEACRLGTRTHKAVEDLLNGATRAQCDTRDIEPEIDAWTRWRDEWATARGLRPFRTELLLCALDERGAICVGGAIDALFRDDAGQYWLLDWKRAKPFGPKLGLRWAGRGTGPAAALPDTPFSRYALQLAIYARMLREQTGIDVGERRLLVRLAPAGEQPGYENVDAHCPECDRAAKRLLRAAGAAQSERQLRAAGAAQSERARKRQKKTIKSKSAQIATAKV